MATALRVSFRFFFDANLWCQVSRTLLQYFQRYRLFSIFHFFVANRMTSSLHNRKMSISLKRKKIFQKEKRHSSVFWKAFQISTKKFSFHGHFKSGLTLSGFASRISRTSCRLPFDDAFTNLSPGSPPLIAAPISNILRRSNWSAVDTNHK